MVLIEHEILNQALKALCKKFDALDGAVILKGDAVVRIMGIEFLCEIKDSIRTTSFHTILNRMQVLMKTEQRPLLLVARYISPTLPDELVGNGINFLDSVGNCHIRYMNGDRLVFQLSNKGERNTLAKEKSYPVFQNAGIKVIFYLLQDLDNVNKTYRDIQAATGVSLGTVKNVVNELVARDFILCTGNRKVLKNRKEMLDLWVENYNEVLKPKLLLGKMSFRTDEYRTKWLAMELPQGMYWGGESGAHMVDTYLEPAIFDIYTDIPTAHLMKTGFVKQDENGEIHVYQKFWNWDTGNHLVPLMLIYADLMGSGNSRCLEMAKRILDNGLNDYK